MMKNTETKKQIMDRKQHYVRQRNMRQTQNGDLTPAQHKALALFCTYRHKIHSHLQDVAEGKSHLSENCTVFLRQFMSVMLRQASLPELNLPSAGLSGADEAYYETVNTKMEEYLQTIDERYGTQYAPRGFARKRICA